MCQADTQTRTLETEDEIAVALAACYRLARERARLARKQKVTDREALVANDPQVQKRDERGLSE
jgi:hypothetical protein